MAASGSTARPSHAARDGGADGLEAGPADAYPCPTHLAAVVASHYGGSTALRTAARPSGLIDLGVLPGRGLTATGPVKAGELHGGLATASEAG